ncbi:phage terminase small subunit [Streptomyces sp. Ju416(a)]|uniref:phage terminase small subunit n=1 Tax=Streptomyces sp. Ju416(a) TaxID=3446591 RepID=UPI00403DFD32
MTKPFSRAHRRPPAAAARAALVDLPGSGCTLPVPEIPERPGELEWSPTELARWDELWRSPQAVMWDDTARGTVAVVLVYESAILAGTASAWMAQEARYAGEALGLTPKALVALGWRIVDEAQE